MLSWTSLDPDRLLRHFEKYEKFFDFKSFEEFMKRVSSIENMK